MGLEPIQKNEQNQAPQSAAASPAQTTLGTFQSYKFICIQDGQLSPDFKAVLDQFKIRTADGKPLRELPIKDVVDRTQAIFFKKAGDPFAKELNAGLEGAGTTKFIAEINASLGPEAPLTSDINAIFNRLGLVETRPATQTCPDKILVFGATAPAIETRIRFLAAQWEKDGLNTKEICLLGAERKLLEPDIVWIKEHLGIDDLTSADLPFVKATSKDGTEELLFNEGIFAKWYIETHKSIELPKEWQSLIQAPQTNDVVGVIKPDTATNIDTLGSPSSATPINLIVVSSQPYVDRQGADALLKLFENGYSVGRLDAIGPSKESPTNSKTYLLELAKLLRAEALLLQLM